MRQPMQKIRRKAQVSSLVATWFMRSIRAMPYEELYALRLRMESKLITDNWTAAKLNALRKEMTSRN